MSVKNVEDVYALSSMQRLMLLQACSSADKSELVEQFTCTLIGKLDRAAFRQAWDEVLCRHPVLRTGFAWQGLKKPLQFVRRNKEIEWSEYDVCDRSEPDRLRRWTEVKDTDQRKGFDLSKPPLLRISLVQTDGNVHRLAWTVHHLVLDGWSLPLVLNEVFALYEAYRNPQGEPCRLPAPRPFREYIRWLTEQDMDAAQSFWRTRLDGYRPDSRLPLLWHVEQNRDSHPVYDEYETTLSPRPLDELQAFAAQQRVTMATVLVAVWGFVLGRLQGQDEVTCGLAVSGRPTTLAGAESIVGPLMNNLPVRMRLARHEYVANWLRTIQVELADVRQFEYTSAEQIYQSCGLTSGRRPFESLFVYENYPLENSRKVGAELEIRDAHGTATASLPLTVIVIPDKELRLRVRYRRQYFSLASIQRLAAHFSATLENMTSDPVQRLVDVDVCSARQRAELANVAAEPPPEEILNCIQDGPLRARRGSPDPADRRSPSALGDLRSGDRLGRETGHSGFGIGSKTAQDGPSLTWQILDHWSRPAPLGVAGELCAAGASVNDSHHKETSTSDMVTDHESWIGQAAGPPLIRTGLFVRRLPDGEWQWLGHTCGTAVGDCRIDLRAVEDHLRQQPLVADATVRVPDQADIRPSIAVFAVPAKRSKSLLDADGRGLLSNQLRSALDHVLPLRIMSLDIVFFDRIPRLADGSPDLASLPATRRSRPESAPAYVAPRDQLEARLAEIWSELLGVDPIGIRDNFVELGGDSARAVSLIGRIEEEFQRKLPLIAMFSEPTVENLATLLRRPSASQEETVLVPIRPQGDRPPLFCVHPAGGTVFCYLALARYLDPAQPVYGLQAVGINGQQAPHNTVTEMAAHYVAAIRSAQTAAPMRSAVGPPAASWPMKSPGS